jgi:hypothetical protein
MTTDIKTDMTTVRLELSQTHRYNIVDTANRLNQTNSLVVVAAWSVLARSALWVPVPGHTDFTYARRVLGSAKIDAEQFEVYGLSYNSPLLMTIASSASGATAIGYGVLRLYNKVLNIRDTHLELRKKKSDLELYELINDQIMDDLRFAKEQKKLLSPELIKRETQLMPGQPPARYAAAGLETSQTPGIDQLATEIAQAAIILPQVERVGVEE